MKKRPERLKGETVKYDMCGSLWITINELDGKPVECFLYGAKLSTCRSQLEALARTVSRLLSEHNDIEGAVDACSKIRCYAISRKIGQEVEKKEKDLQAIPWSCPDAIARELERYIK